MRIKIQLNAIDKAIILPIHYNATIQGFIYQHLEASLAQWIHDHGWADAKRHLKLFTFSRPHGTFHRRGGTLYFPEHLTLTIASPMDTLLESLALHLMQTRIVRLGETRAELASIEVIAPAQYQCPVFLKALSPITVYSTLETLEGHKKTYYYAPQEPEFAKQILANLQRKIRAWSGVDISFDDANFRPVKVSNRNLVVARYKSTIIKGWTGIYELSASEPYFRMALNAGLGAKNSQGFGFVEVWKPRGKVSHRDTEETR